MVLQAGAMGIPSIVSDINGCNEIITNNYNGVIVPKNNYDELKKIMLYMYENQKILEDLAKNSKKNIIEKFDSKKIWKMIINEYDMLLKINFR